MAAFVCSSLSEIKRALSAESTPAKAADCTDNLFKVLLNPVLTKIDAAVGDTITLIG